MAPRPRPTPTTTGRTDGTAPSEAAAPSTEKTDPTAPYRDKIKIDRNDLDTMLIEQPQHYADVAHQFALAISRRDRAKHVLDETRARIDNEERQLARDNEEKVTDSLLTARITVHPDVVQANKVRDQWARMAAIWEALKEAFEQRSYALKDLCALYHAGYWANSTGGGERRDASDRRYEDDKAAIARGRRGEG